MSDFKRIFGLLTDADVEFVLIGGLSVIAHGHQRATLDVDICYARTPKNIARLAAALAPVHPRLRGAPAELKFPWDAQTLANGLNFTLVTDLGDLDLLGEVAGLGSYEDIALSAIEIALFGCQVAMLNLDQLIRSKAAAGRVKDLLDLEALRKLQSG